MKKILLTIGLAGMCVAAQAQYSISQAYTVANNSTMTNLLNFPASVSKIQLLVGLPITNLYQYAFADAPKTNGSGILLSTPALTNIIRTSNFVSFLTNVAITVTNYEGVTTNLWRSNVLHSAWGAGTDTAVPYPAKLVGSTTAGGVITVFDSSTPLRLANGLTFTNTVPSSNITVIVTFDPSL